MSDDFLNTNYSRLMLLEFIVDFKVITRWKETIILVHCNKCDNLQYSLTLYLWTKLTSVVQLKKGKVPNVWITK